MRIQILKDYIDYCNENNKVPEFQELLQWKNKYNDARMIICLV
jgi:hypothetical protein